VYLNKSPYRRHLDAILPKIKLSNQFKDQFFAGFLECNDPAILKPLYRMLKLGLGQPTGQERDLDVPSVDLILRAGTSSPYLGPTTR
jgi:hypothetical protein